MNIYFHKLLPLFFLPTGLVLLLLVAGLLFRRRMLIWAALVLFLVCSTPLVSNFLMRMLENGTERIDATAMPTANAIVVLSEGRVVAPGTAGVSEWVDGDRFWGGMELYQAGKAPLLVFTGGRTPWQAQAKPEGDVLMAYAQTLGVPLKAMMSTGIVVNTAEEAREVAALLWQRGVSDEIASNRLKVLLVTSAYHMPRAKQLFENAGLVVVSYPVDFKVSASQDLSVMDFLPSAGDFQQTEMVCREFIGRLYYRYKLR